MQRSFQTQGGNCIDVKYEESPPSNVLQTFIKEPELVI